MRLWRSRQNLGTSHSKSTQPNEGNDRSPAPPFIDPLELWTLLALILTLSFVLVGVAAGEEDLEPDPDLDLDLDAEPDLDPPPAALIGLFDLDLDRDETERETDLDSERERDRDLKCEEEGEGLRLWNMCSCIMYSDLFFYAMFSHNQLSLETSYPNLMLYQCPPSCSRTSTTDMFVLSSHTCQS